MESDEISKSSYSSLKGSNEARPRVIPVFITGLGNNLPKRILGNWTGDEKVRIWFAKEIDLTESYSQRNALRAYKKISDFLMEKIGELGDEDKDFMSWLCFNVISSIGVGADTKR